MRAGLATLLFITALMLVGCASLRTAIDQAINGGGNLCLPPGAHRDVTSWTMTNSEEIIGPADDGTPVSVTMTYYARGAQRVAVLWYRGVPVFYDARPDDPHWPSYVNARYITEDHKIRVEPLPGDCKWRLANSERT